MQNLTFPSCFIKPVPLTLACEALSGQELSIAS